MTYHLDHHAPLPPHYVPFDPEDLHNPIGTRLEKTVRLYPERIAIDDDLTRTITYAELNQAANRVAHAVLEHEMQGLGAAVGLLFGFGVEALISFYAVQKAGRMVMALDPTYPQGRNQFILHDSGARILLTDHKHRSMADVYANYVDVILNVEDVIAASHADHNPGLDIPIDTPSNMTYTSGSTGQPKGVIHTHRKNMHIQYYANDLYRFNSRDRSIHYSSLSYMNSLLQIHSVMLNGGAILPYDLRTRPVDAFARWIRERQVTYLSLVPTIFRQMCQSLSGDDEFPDMRIFGIGGEPARASDIDAFKRWFGHSTFKFNYATSETSTITQGFAQTADAIDRDAIPVGYAFGEHEVLLVDGHDNPVDKGEPGEFIVRSRSISPGYWKRPDLTAEKFTADEADPTLLTFRTGDLGMRVDGGWYVHLGRRDHQIKIRGFRVETGEIETALVALPEIREAVVLARQDARSTLMLVAYIVPDEGQPIALEVLRQTLSRSLPDYMIPARFVILDQMPYTVTGKIDRAALPAVGRERPALTTPYVAPRTDLEREITALWQDVLDTDGVGVDDPFLDVGGNSLLATQLVSRMADRFGSSVSFEAFFAASTVAQMAALIEEADGQADGSSARIEPLPRIRVQVDPVENDPDDEA